MPLHPHLQSRRAFLRSTAFVASAASTVPGFLLKTGVQAASPPRSDTTQPILVILQMAGGNDGLNTLVPFADDHYRKARPSLALPSRELHKLSDTVGLHPALVGLRELFDDGRLAAVQGVGYPNPVRSHFRSMEIWQTASDANKVAKWGWLGRYFDAACAGAEPQVGIAIGREAPQAFAGPKPIGINLDEPELYQFASADDPDGADNPMAPGKEPGMISAGGSAAGASIAALSGPTTTNLSPVDFIERVAIDARISSAQILAMSRRPLPTGDFPASRLGQSLRLVAQLIGAKSPTRIYHVSQGGYDTHTQQPAAHERLLRDMSDSVRAFLREIDQQKESDRVLVMTFSEFGRRVAENANRGTDHGAGSVLFLAGNRVKPGLHGRYPSCAPADLHQGDLKATVDFRAIYATLLELWLKTPATPVLGRPFDTLPLVA